MGNNVNEKVVNLSSKENEELLENTTSNGDNNEAPRRRSQEKKKKKKNSFLSNIILIIGIVGMLVGGTILGTTLYKEWDRAKQTKAFINDAMGLIKPENYIPRDQFNPVNGDRVGILELPSPGGMADKGIIVPIVEGVGDENIHASVGHYESTHWPGDQRQIFLTGHRNTEFGVLKHVVEGDEIIMKMQYGEFKYRITHTKIIHETEVSVIDPDGEYPNDQLILMTCYPFTFGADTEERFLVYAERVVE